eukprot:scaffold647904_cov40-Prasinocladus_malaysianus.AAC.1
MIVNACSHIGKANADAWMLDYLTWKECSSYEPVVHLVVRIVRRVEHFGVAIDEVFGNNDDERESDRDAQQDRQVPARLSQQPPEEMCLVESKQQEAPNQQQSKDLERVEVPIALLVFLAIPFVQVLTFLTNVVVEVDAWDEATFLASVGALGGAVLAGL